jgi:alkanesulfonate monooxygenase SsuD/methylene tetrahydromethanopterin reductase-like flavin-dependent oxidoreductase (luciferase family)
MPLRYAIHVPTFAEPNVLVDLAVTAEDRGWDGFLLWDHILGSREMTLPIVDSWVALGAIAHATTRIRIGTAITPEPRRRPWKLTREVTTLDRLSHGRAILGVGLGNPIDAEYAPFGEPTDPRILAGRLDEGLEIIDGLFAGEPVHHAGTHYRVHGATFGATSGSTSPDPHLGCLHLAAPPSLGPRGPMGRGDRAENA